MPYSKRRINFEVTPSKYSEMKKLMNEKEFSQMTASLPWITVHASRVGLTEVTTKALDQMVKDIEKGASLLADASVDGICLACTSVSFIIGIDDRNPKIIF